MQLNQYLSTLYLFSIIFLLRPKVSFSAVQYNSVHLRCEDADLLLSNRPPTSYTTNQTPVTTSTFHPASSGYVFTHSGILQLWFSCLLQLSGLQRLTSTAPFTCPSNASTSSYCFVKQRAVCIINVWGYTEILPEDHTLINLLPNAKLYMTRNPA